MTARDQPKGLNMEARVEKKSGSNSFCFDRKVNRIQLWQLMERRDGIGCILKRFAFGNVVVHALFMLWFTLGSSLKTEEDGRDDVMLHRRLHMLVSVSKLYEISYW